MSNPDIKTPHRCRLGKICADRDRCVVHDWIYYHDEAYVGLWILGIIIVVAFLVVWGAITVIGANEPIRANIEGFNCKQLAEYIADKDSLYGYAEHRYEWLCVNQQVKEFQG